MKYRIITEAGKEIKRFVTEQEAEKYWDMMNIDAVSAYENNGRDFDLTKYTEI